MHNNHLGRPNCDPTRERAIEDSFQMSVKLLSQDGAVVHVARVNKTLCCIFEQQVTFSVLTGLKEPELCVWVGCQRLLCRQKINMCEKFKEYKCKNSSAILYYATKNFKWSKLIPCLKNKCIVLKIKIRGRYYKNSLILSATFSFQKKSSQIWFL